MAWWTDFPQTDTFGSTWGIAEGYRTRPAQHIDIGTPEGVGLSPRQPGQVTKRGNDPQLGLYVDIRDRQGRTWRYFHLSAVHLNVGDYADENTRFATSGNTGSSSGPHTSIRLFDGDGRIVDPTPHVYDPVPFGQHGYDPEDPGGGYGGGMTSNYDYGDGLPGDDGEEDEGGGPASGWTDAGGGLQIYRDSTTGAWFKRSLIDPGFGNPGDLDYRPPRYSAATTFTPPSGVVGRDEDARALDRAQIDRIRGQIELDARGADVDAGRLDLDRSRAAAEEEIARGRLDLDRDRFGLDRNEHELRQEETRRRQDLEDLIQAEGTWAQRAQNAIASGNLEEARAARIEQNAIARERIALEAELGYAESERADVRLNLDRQGQAFNQQMDLRNQAIELARSPRSYLEQAAIAGGYELPAGITLFDTLNRAGQQVPDVETFLNEQATFRRPPRDVGGEPPPTTASLTPPPASEGYTRGPDRNIADWGNMSNEQALRTFSAAELARGDRANAASLSNEELLRIGAETPGGVDEYLRGFSADRIRGTGQYAGSGFGQDVIDRVYGTGGAAPSSAPAPVAAAAPPTTASAEPPEVRAQRMAEEIKRRRAVA